MRSLRGAAVAAFVAALMLMEGPGSAALAAPVSGRPGAATAAGATAAGASATAPVEERPCPVTVPAGTTCGYLLVPERRDVPNSRTIKVGYAVHRAGGEAPGQVTGQAGAQDADPVVYMSGGPGSASLQLTGLLTQMLPGRDVIVLEQRGGRYSEPRLSCPEIVEGIVDTLRTPGPTADETAAVVRRAAACQSRLESEHVDLRGYRTAEIAADIVDLRSALGYRRWYLFGVSYSTRPMLRAAALDPQGSRGIVLDSLLPPRARWYDESPGSLTATMAKLGLTSRFDTMVAALNAHPAAYETRDPLTRKRLTVWLNGDDVATILGEALHETDVIPVMPALVDGLAAGRTELLQPLVDQAGDGLTSHEWGLYYAVQCQDETPGNSFPGSAHPRLFTGVVDAAVCGAWGLPASRTEPDALTPDPAVTAVGADATIAGRSATADTRGTTTGHTTARSATAEGRTAGRTNAGTARAGGNATRNAFAGHAAAESTATTGTATTGATAEGRATGRATAGSAAARRRTAGKTTAGGGVPILALGGRYDPTTPPEAAREAVSAVPGARFAEFDGVGHAVFLSSECGRRTIAAFLADPASAARPCDPGVAPYAMVRPGDLLLTSSVYRMLRSPAPLAIPAAFLLVAAVQLLVGLVSLLRRRGGGLSVLAGLAGVVLGALSALSLSAITDPVVLAIGVPPALAWFGLLAIVCTVLSVIEAFRLTAGAAKIVPALTGMAFLAWLYGWLLA
ncbi:alpha/beta fold hydrolase [Microbispora sp. H10949]|uniref:alpha/beta fold hydrolase n=1 Tax=Microbispora sp. H10949 TaxID=2729111 RepID=UPI00160207A0|nr:alpha/beta fold hydrolase [Microbispora sp. H10949]